VREVLKKEKVETGTIMLDAAFSPVRRVNYEVENMRVGERTDYNRLRFLIETDGSIAPRDALENSIKTLVRQLGAIVGFSEDDIERKIQEIQEEQIAMESEKMQKGEEEMTRREPQMAKEDGEQLEEDFLKTRVEDLSLSSRTVNALSKAGIRTVGGLTRKKEEDLLKIEGVGDKAINEIRRALGNFGLILK